RTAMPIPSEDPIIVAPSPTPIAEDDSVDFAAIEHNVKLWLETPLSGFVLNSENGEEAFLSEAERLEIVRTVRRVCDGRKFVIGGIDCPSVTETLRLGERLVEAGAELLRVRIPRLTSNVRDYFQQVAKRAAAPIILIHQMAPGMFLSGPAATGASAELLGELTALENVFGYIMSDNIRFESRVRMYAAADKRFWTCNGTLLLPGAALGANGACLMLANVYPKECREIVRLVMAGKLTEAQAIQRRVIEVDWQILSRGAAGIKAALNLLGYHAGRPRSPSPACADAAIAQIKAAMERVG
ncbi:MAG TPA: dihydrodipicolinate synthase family protein, partial [Pirellulales bacterium]|nr:dihydrodipicolinate synthase family protein [Pirellulales bacterium]